MGTMTRQIAFAAARDAGNRAMRQGGRKVWSAGDYRKACEELDRLLALVEPQKSELPG